jgi:hypothetical protein
VSSSQPTHGIRSTYSNHGCRCAECREANRVYGAAARAQRRSQPEAADRAGHGTRSTYANYGCRCAACRAAHAAHMRDQRANHRTTKED